MRSQYRVATRRSIRLRSSFDNQHHAAVEGDGKRLSTAHAAHSTGNHKFAFERPAEMALRECGERLESALQDALRADVDPTPRRHLAVHHQASAIEFVEVLPSGPFAHQVGVGDEDARSHFVRWKHRDRLARLHQQRFVALQPLQLAHDGVVALPVACGLADTTVDYEIRGALGVFRIQVVHQAAQRRFLLPSLAVQPCSARRANDGSCSRCHRLLPMRYHKSGERARFVAVAKTDPQDTPAERNVL